MTKVLIVFYSRNGSVEALAKAVAAGAESVGAEVRIRRARELVDAALMAAVPGWAENAERMNALYPAPTAEDAQWADAILFGSPTRFGLMASELKAFLDSLGALWQRGELNLKAGSAFASTTTAHGGNEMTALTMFIPMAHFGMVIVPPGYSDPVMFRAGAPYGATSVSGGKTGPSEDELAVATHQGARVAHVAALLQAAHI